MSRCWFLKEICWVERTLEVVVRLAAEEEPVLIRIEALRHAKSGRCFTEAYRRENWTVRPTCPPRKDRFAPNHKPRDTWVPYDLGWTEGATPDAVIQQALGFLGLRCKE